jgi:hypothetical protein
MMKQRIKTQVKIWTVAVSVAALVLFAGYQFGRAGDCRPGEIDGQCGMSTFLGVLYGLLGGILALACAAFYSIHRFRRDSKSSESSM